MALFNGWDGEREKYHNIQCSTQFRWSSKCFLKFDNLYMDVSKNRGFYTPKMDGENNGKPY